MIQLRPYQNHAIYNARQNFAAGIKRVLLVAPTGAGKTVMFSHMAHTAISRGHRVLIVTDRLELINQAGGTLGKFEMHATKVDAGQKTNPNLLPGKLFTAMAETLKRRLKGGQAEKYERFLESFNFVIFDEAHKQSFRPLLAALPESTFVIGATATPWRAGSMAPALAAEYGAMINTAEVLELIALGSLVPAESYGAPMDLSGVHVTAGEYNDKELFDKFNKRELYANVVQKYKDIAPNTKALCFCVNVEHSKNTARAFVEAGILSRHLDAESGEAERTQTLADFRAGTFQVLCNVGLFTTGYDEPTVTTIILNRATKSLALFLQMCGRGSRPYPGKSSYTIIDMGNNILEHGFWEQNRAELWAQTFHGSPPKEKKKQAPNIIFCEKCAAIMPAGTKICPMCFAEMPKVVRKFEEPTKDVQLVKLSYNELPAELKKPYNQMTVAELESVRSLRGYKIGWLVRQLENVEQLREYANLKGYKPGFVFKNLDLLKTNILAL